MIGTLIEYGTSTVTAVVIIGVGLGSVFTLGEHDQAVEATLQAVRWFAAGSVAGITANAFINEPTSVGVIVGAMALCLLVWVEYYILGMEKES